VSHLGAGPLEPGQRVACVAGKAARAGSVALKTEDEWPLAFLRFSSLY
jgi:hypothetical protein